MPSIINAKNNNKESGKVQTTINIDNSGETQRKEQEARRESSILSQFNFSPWKPSPDGDDRSDTTTTNNQATTGRANCCFNSFNQRYTWRYTNLHDNWLAAFLATAVAVLLILTVTFTAIHYATLDDTGGSDELLESMPEVDEELSTSTSSLIHNLNNNNNNNVTLAPAPTASTS